MKIRKKLERLNLRFKMIKNHPLSGKNSILGIYKYIAFNTLQTIYPKPRVYNWIENLKFYAKKGDAGIVGNIYYQLMDYEESMFLLNHLKKEDVFVDVGANLGHFSMLASGICKAKTIAIEPIESTIFKLKRNLELNKLFDKVTILNYGVGDKEEFLNFTTHSDVMNAVSTFQTEKTVKIQVKTLNELLKNIDPTFIKIDVEGYEYNVIKGADKVLINPALKYLLVEFNNSGSKFNLKDEDVYKMILNYNFIPIGYNVERKEIIPLKNYNTHKFNTLFIRKNA
jgi:FkbM family methyltransferase